MSFLESSNKLISIKNDAGESITHVFRDEDIDAINAALAIRRPLLIRGEPGIGKSQIARAAAMALKRAYVSFTVDIHTEPRDLQWSLDAVARLADAQVGKRLDPLRHKPDNEWDSQTESAKDADSAGANAIPVQRYLIPGPLWWAYDWDQAAKIARDSGHQAPAIAETCSHNNGVVVLIDEIDKADVSVPNGLLEALGAGQFQPQGLDRPVVSGDPQPLVIITSNEERALPDAFVRRCLSLFLDFPNTREERMAFLQRRAEKNHAAFSRLDSAHIAEAARMLCDDREWAESQHLRPLPGQAEFFDLLRGLNRLAGVNGYEVDDLLKRLRPYTYRKHPWPADGNETP